MKQDDGFEMMAEEIAGKLNKVFTINGVKDDIANALRQVSKEAFNKGVEASAELMSDYPLYKHRIRSLKKEG